MTTHDDDFFPVPLTDLRKDTLVSFDFFLPIHADGPPVLYRNRDLAFSDDVRLRLIERGIDEVLVRTAQRAKYHRYMEKNIRSALNDASISPDEKATILYSTSCEMVRQFLEDPTHPEVVTRTRDIVGAAVGHLLADEGSFASFLKTTSLDYRTYTHSVNVSMYTLNLAQRLGVTDPVRLNEIGTGTFLHDIGKSRVPDKILNKEGPLTDAEWHIMRNHTVWGHEILRSHGVTSAVILSITRDHHEKLNGTGYPTGLDSAGLPDYVRMTTICDVFDALTTRRSYKGEMDSFRALKIMRNEMAGQLDSRFFAAFVSMLHVEHASAEATAHA